MRTGPTLAVPFAVALAACGRADSAPVQRAGGGGPPAAAVDVVPVVSRPLDTVVHLEGELAPWEIVAIYPRVTGFVASITVDRASVVRCGQVLARLIAPELAAQRAEADARVLADQGTYERLRAAARTPGVVARNDVELAAAAVEADRAHARALRDLEQYLVVTAPFDGVVTERNVHPGALVGPSATGTGVPMLRIEHLAHLRLVTAVPEALAGEIALGARAGFAVRAWPERRFEGTIARPAHAVEERTRTMPVELDVDNAAGELAPGMYTDVAWPVRRATPSLFVPRTAVVQSSERLYVVRVREGVAEPVTVQRGATAGEEVEITGAIAAGDLVVRRAHEDLRAGTRVTAHVLAPDGGAGPSGR